LKIPCTRSRQFFLDELLRCGTTTAMVYCTVHPASVDAFFEASAARNLRMVAGKVLMDRNCPEFLRDTAEGGIRDSETLIKNGISMAASSTLSHHVLRRLPARQMQLAGELAHAYTGYFYQTHVAENQDECAWAPLFQKRSYLDIYDRYGLMRERAMFAHCIWLNDEDRARMAATRSAVALCPTSNLFLGSGLFDFSEPKPQTSRCRWRPTSAAAPRFLCCKR
jgi:guanine deaminase